MTDQIHLQRPAPQLSGVTSTSTFPPGYTCAGCTIGSKLVFERAAKTILAYSEAFAHKLLCTGPVLNLGDTCVYSCSFCYVPSMLWKILFVLFRATGLTHAGVVVRRKAALQQLRNNLKSQAGFLSTVERRKKHVVFTSTTVDPAATVELVRETAAAICIIFEETNWDVRVLSKSNLLPQLAKLIPLKWKDRVIYGVSTGTLDDDLARTIEVGTPLVSKRIQSLHWLQDNGFRTFGMICPSLPQSDYDKFSADICAAIRGDRCEEVWAEVINLRGESFTRTITGLLKAGFVEEANMLSKVCGPGAGHNWEQYARETFLAHVRHIPARKLKFLQYPSQASQTWWKAQVKHGAVLLGTHAP